MSTKILINAIDPEECRIAKVIDNRLEEFQIESIPAVLDGGLWIMTANGDRNNTASSYVSFTADRSVTVYIAFDAQASSLPTWMADFTGTDQFIGVTDPLSPQLRLYSRSYSSGNITLGGNLAGGNNGADSNYIVIVTPN